MTSAYLPLIGQPPYCLRRFYEILSHLRLVHSYSEAMSARADRMRRLAASQYHLGERHRQLNIIEEAVNESVAAGTARIEMPLWHSALLGNIRA